MADENHPMQNDTPMLDDEQKGYALSGKIMLSAIVILFVVVVFMVVLHLYARWYLLRQRRRALQNRRHRLEGRRTQIVFYVDNPNNPHMIVAGNRGLEPAVLGSLPVFTYSEKTHPEKLECAVCLSEFEENEKGRVLPKCNHCFHIECIDMWFHSHSTCPLCRSPVEPMLEPEKTRLDVAVNLGEMARDEAESGSSSGLCMECQHEEENLPATSLGSRRKGLDLTGVRIEVPRRYDSEDELGLNSPASQGYRSPGSRLLSLKRILSMTRKTPTGSGAGTSHGLAVAVPELDLEIGGAELSRMERRSQTPR